MIRIAVIGDVHGHFSTVEVDYFNDSSYKLILFVGDLAHFSHRSGLETAEKIARLRKPTLLIPGNHDTVTGPQLLAEIKKVPALQRITAVGHEGRVRVFRESLGEILFCGYSTHPFTLHGSRFDVIAARPYSMGGPYLGYRRHLVDAYGIDTMASSAERLKQCVDEAESEQIIFLAHNGPFGLGSSREDIWGNDFEPGEGDYGDPDLQAAVDYAKERGLRVIAVVAGHMHQSLIGGGRRQWHVEAEGTHYINAARVPRIFQENGKSVHHHVSLSFDDESVSVEEVLVS
jgi:uncharacterized protein (TIGR04168 family)